MQRLDVLAARTRPGTSNEIEEGTCGCTGSGRNERLILHQQAWQIDLDPSKAT